MKNLHIIIFFILVLSACNKPTEPENSTAKRENCQCEAESYRSDSKGALKKGFFEGREITYTKIDGLNIWEGDIALRDEDIETVHTDGTISSAQSHKWPNNTVVWAYGPGLGQTAKDKWNAAMKHWQSNTRVRFRQRVFETDYVRVIKDKGCYSYIGRIGGAQNLSIDYDCSVGNTIHEIGHAIGLHHEHTRTDRNQSIVVNTANIEAGKEHNFDICTFCTSNGTMDFGSIMMYGSFAFSANGLPTITTLNGGVFTVQRNGLSANDIAIVGTVYK